MKPKIEDYAKTIKALKDYGLTKEEAIACMQEIAKDNRVELIREAKVQTQNELATDKQKAWLDKNTIEYKPSITKQEASDLISKEINKKK